MKTFVLDRKEDESGVSGTGVVAEGVEFESGKCVICWLVKPHGLAIYDSIQHVEDVHGHQGRTVIVWDEEYDRHDLIDPDLGW